MLHAIGSPAHILADIPNVKFITDEIEQKRDEVPQEVLERPETVGVDAEAASRIPSNGDAGAATIPAGGATPDGGVPNQAGQP